MTDDFELRRSELISLANEITVRWNAFVQETMDATIAMGAAAAKSLLSKDED